MDIFFQLVPMLIVFVVFYLVLLLPEKKRKKQYMQMLDNLQVNDEIMTRGGIIGKIISLDGENMVLESGPDRARLKMTKNAIANKIYKED
ncbi:MAG: preprotein translocase subunit YajC [Clostridium sp.]|uniref:Preprotein translocase subunit YajC n=1 Tax=Clostridium paraputrificum TaxID=29363 RepID=A0A6N3BWC9_9CLOT|nr:preprotein translocase subunit YajC [Clostridium sp.]MBS5925579.1 preprotein translocase subunit YajC [Clostridium sp.]MBS5986224.1 preprotein translocase subunit YajC [Clostridium sp.]